MILRKFCFPIKRRKKAPTHPRPPPPHYAPLYRVKKNLVYIHRKTPLLEPFLIKLQAFRPETLLKRDSNTDVSQ